MKVIELTKGHVAIVDDEDFQSLAQWRWHWSDGYARRRKTIGFKKTVVVGMHAEIMNPGEGFEADHINGSKLDNRRSNLRLSTRSQNSMNKRVMSNNKLGMKGVCFSKHQGKFRATITKMGATRHIGWFDTSEQAKAAYDKAAIEIHQQFARLN